VNQFSFYFSEKICFLRRTGDFSLLKKKRTEKEERIKNIPKEIEDLKKFTEEVSTISIKDLKSGYSIDVERLRERISNFIDEKTHLLDFLKKESYKK